MLMEIKRVSRWTLIHSAYKRKQTAHGTRSQACATFKAKQRGADLAFTSCYKSRTRSRDLGQLFELGTCEKMTLMTADMLVLNGGLMPG